MTPTLKIDTAPFQAALRKYMEYSKSSLQKVVNEKAFSILLSASILTPKADYDKMYSEIGPTAEKITGYKLRITKRRMTKKEMASG